jgi:glycosyltransferase involved in cell wall biosynthesis
MPHPEDKPPIAGAPLSVAIPIRDQSERVTPSLSAWQNLLDKLERPYEILLIDDGSVDDTATRAEAYAAKHSHVVLLRHAQPLGFGAALRTALEKAQYPLFFYTAFDYPYQPADLRKLLDRINDVDLVTGFRSAVPVPGVEKVLRKLLAIAARVLIGLRTEPLPGWLGVKSHLDARFVQLFFGVHVGDTDSAFKLFRREILTFPIQSDGPFVHVEILAKANFLTCWVDELPIGAQAGSKAEVLLPRFRWRDRWRDMRRVFSDPDFGSGSTPTQPAPALYT